MRRRWACRLAYLVSWAEQNGVPDGAVVVDDQRRPVRTTAPGAAGNRLCLHVHDEGPALTWQELRDYAGMPPVVEVWFSDRPVVDVRLTADGAGAPVLMLQRFYE